MSPEPSSQEIADGLKQGSPEAFRALYALLGGSILAYLTRLTGRKEMAEELTQETFLTAIRKIGFFRSGPDGGLKAWVFRIATNRALDVLRREHRNPAPLQDFQDLQNHEELRLEIPDETPGPEAVLERVEVSQSLAVALQTLTTAQRTIFLLKEQEEMSLLEISRVCGLSQNAIKQSLFRARAALREKLCE